MAVLYHRETTTYSGADLAARIAEWQQQAVPNLHADGITSTMHAEARTADS